MNKLLLSSFNEEFPGYLFSSLKLKQVEFLNRKKKIYIILVVIFLFLLIFFNNFITPVGLIPGIIPEKPVQIVEETNNLLHEIMRKRVPADQVGAHEIKNTITHSPELNQSKKEVKKLIESNSNSTFNRKLSDLNGKTDEVRYFIRLSNQVFKHLAHMLNEIYILQLVRLTSEKSVELTCIRSASGHLIKIAGASGYFSLVQGDNKNAHLRTLDFLADIESEQLPQVCQNLHSEVPLKITPQYTLNQAKNRDNLQNIVVPAPCILCGHIT